MRMLPLKDKAQVGLWSARYIADRINQFHQLQNVRSYWVCQLAELR